MRGAADGDGGATGPGRWIVRGALVLLMAGVVVTAIPLVLPYEVAVTRFRAFFPDRVGYLTPERYAAIRGRLLSGVLLLGGTAAAAFTLRRRLVDLADRGSAALGRWLRAEARSARQALAEDGAPVRVALVALLGGALALRLAYLAQPMRFDESFTWIRYASKPLPVAVSVYSAPNNHVFHTILVWLSSRILTPDPWALRLPAFLAGLSLVPATFALGRRLFSPWAGLLAAASVTASSQLVEYSTNARGYSMVALFFILCLVTAARLIREPRAGGWIVLAILSALGFWTVPVFLYPFITVLLWLGLSARFERRGIGLEPRSSLRALGLTAVGTVVITAVLYAPAMAVTGPASVLANEFVTPLSFGSFAAGLPEHLVRSWQAWTRDLPIWLQVVLGLGVLASALPGRREEGSRVPLLIPTILGCAGLLLAQRVIPFVRVWVFLVPLFMALAWGGWMSGLGRLRGGRRFLALLAPPGALVLAGWLGLGLLRSDSVLRAGDPHGLRDAEAAALYLASALRPGDAVVVGKPVNRPLEYYLLRKGVPGSFLVEPPAPGGRVFVAIRDADVRPELPFLVHPVAGWAASARPSADPRPVRSYDSGTVYMTRLGDEP